MSDEFHVSIPARLSEVRELSRLVEAFGDANGLPDPKVYVINLALDELIANTVMYGLEEVSEAEIAITLRVAAGKLILIMEDNGKWFDPTQDTQADVSSTLEDRAVGGLGLHLVKSLTDRMSYEFANGWNRLTLEHDLTPAAE